MILGKADQERLNTAEHAVVDAQAEAIYWRQRSANAEAQADAAEHRVAEEVAHNQRLTAWARDLARDAGRAIQDAEAHADTLAPVAAAIRQLHERSDLMPVCTHCGHAWPCPTIAALPSDP